jgi:hypothetical protein
VFSILIIWIFFQSGSFGTRFQRVNHSIVIDGLRWKDSISNLCRREGINDNLYYRWSKDFLEAGKKRLMGDTTREANFKSAKLIGTTGYKLETSSKKDLTLG